MMSQDPPDGTTLPPSGVSSSETIGGCRLIRKLGEGGMGDVWLAEQQQPRRRVAIKLIKLGMDTTEVMARFAVEQQALALMDHPGIARMFEAGATLEGRPYFVMEFVAGVPLTQYCDNARSTVRQRLDLFLQICAAVQHAHHKAIVHRDLKPSNVLVADIDGRPVPKIIDFGIAKAMVTPLTDQMMVTQFGAAVGTPAYMSPEQLDTSGSDVDTRSDVYALGVILYELIAGVPPVDTQSAQSIEEVRERVRTVEPVRPSTRFVAIGPAASEIASKRGVDAVSLKRALRGDLDWIVLKALEKDRNRRYGSPSELAADLERHLVKQPVLARPPSTRYRVGRFVSRHRFGVAASGTALLLLVGFATAMGILATRLADERDRVTQEMQSKEQITAFLQELFTLSTPERAQGRTLTAKDVLQRGVERIDQLPPNQVDLRADLLSAMGKAFESLGSYDEAERLFRQGLQVTQPLPRSSERALVATKDLSFLLLLRGRYSESASLAEEALSRANASLGERNLLTLRLKEGLAMAYWPLNRLTDAARLLEEALQSTRQMNEPDTQTILSLSNNLALVYADQGRIAEAVKLDEEVLATRRRTLGNDHPMTLASLNNLAARYAALKRFAEARQMLFEAIATGERVLGPEHPRLGLLVHSLGEVEFAAGEHQAAVAQFSRAVNIYKADAKARFMPQVLYQLAQSSAHLGQRDQAFDYLGRALAAGYKPNPPASEDPHLAALQSDRRFPRLVNRSPK